MQKNHGNCVQTDPYSVIKKTEALQMAPSEYFNEGKKISSWAMTQNKLQQQHLKNKIKPTLPL